MQKNIFIRFVLIIVIPSGLIFFFANQFYINFSINNQIETNTQLIGEMRKNLDTKLDYYRQMTIQFYLNDDAMAQILDNTPILDCNHIIDQLNSFVNANRLISSAYLYTEKGSVYSGTGMIGTDEINRELQEELQARGGKIVWSPSRYMKNNYGLEQNYFFGSRHIRKDDKQIATLHVGFGELFWNDFFENTPFSDGQTIVICDQEGNVIASNDNRPVGGIAYSADVMAAIRQGLLPAHDVSGDSERIILASKSKESDWFVTLAILPHTVSDKLLVIRNIFYLSVLLYLVFFLYLSYVLSKSLSQPLHDLTLALNKVGDGTLNVQVNENQIDEVKQLSRSFNTMTQRIQSLLEDIKAEEREKRKATMQTLQLQLTPHFLYNTLNTIRWMAQMNGQDHIKEISKALISFLKEVSNIQSEFLTVEKEICLLQNYGIIQRYRYRNFHLVLRVPDNVKQYYINKMMLVNLMENSIIHGFHEKQDEGEISIHIDTEGHDLVIRFSDNGVGFDSASLNLEESYITDNIGESYEHTHIGLTNIQRRLRLYYGSEYGLNVESAHGEGCRVTIRIPLLIEPLDA